MPIFDKIATKGKLSLGLVFPLESYHSAIAKMEDQEKLAQLAEQSGFKALWFRDVPFNDPNFGDAGQLYDPWVYMTHIMNHTANIALGSASIILPLRHPVHTVKAMNSLQLLSKARLLLGVASGDRPIEYPAFNQDVQNRSELFRDSFAYIKALQSDFPQFASKHYGAIKGGIDLLPKYSGKTPLVVTGHSGQSLDWIAEHADGWLYYPRDFNTLAVVMQQWKDALKKTQQPWKPFLQSLYVDLVKDTEAKPRPIHLGFRSGTAYLNAHLKMLESYGVNHVILNLKYGSTAAEAMMEEIAKNVIPNFS